MEATPLFIFDEFIGLIPFVNFPFTFWRSSSFTNIFYNSNYHGDLFAISGESLYSIGKYMYFWNQSWKPDIF
jgi:hypothetical protein